MPCPPLLSPQPSPTALPDALPPLIPQPLASPSLPSPLPCLPHGLPCTLSQAAAALHSHPRYPTLCPAPSLFLYVTPLPPLLPPTGAASLSASLAASGTPASTPCRVHHRPCIVVRSWGRRVCDAPAAQGRGYPRPGVQACDLGCAHPQPCCIRGCWCVLCPHPYSSRA